MKYWVIREGKIAGKGRYYSGTVFAETFGAPSRFNAVRFSDRKETRSVLAHGGCRLVRVRRVGARDGYRRGLKTAEHIVSKLAEHAHDASVKVALQEAVEHINVAEWTHPYQ